MRCVPTEAVGRDALLVELLRPLSRYLEMEGATEIVINEPGAVFVEVGPEWLRYEDEGLSMSRLMSLARAIATFTEQDIGPQHPMLSATLPGGQRVQVITPPVVPSGTMSFSIRVPGSRVKSLTEYVSDGSFEEFVWAEPAALEAQWGNLSDSDRYMVDCLRRRALGEFLRAAVKSRRNIAVVGDTGSGKTTLMKAICQSIDASERLVTIEDVRELELPRHQNKVHLLYSKGGQGFARVTPGELIAANMRMKPDRVLLAELRGAEAFDFLKLLTTGHSGSITSFHAESCALAFERYVFLAKEHEQAATFDAAALKRLITLTLDVVVHIAATTVGGNGGEASRKRRAVREVHFDPIAKLQARFGAAQVRKG